MLTLKCYKLFDDFWPLYIFTMHFGWMPSGKWVDKFKEMPLIVHSRPLRRFRATAEPAAVQLRLRCLPGRENVHSQVRLSLMTIKALIEDTKVLLNYFDTVLRHA